MEKTEIERRYQKVCQDIYEGRIKSALDALGALLRNVNQSEFFFDLENITENYQSLLNYAFEGAKDPDRKEILKKISASVLSLADEVRDTLTAKDYPHKNMEKAVMMHLLGDDPQAVSDRLEEFLSEKNLQKMLKETGTSSSEAKPIDSIFLLIWLTHKMKDTSIDKIRPIAHSTI
jgi:hypothetical protein